MRVFFAISTFLFFAGCSSTFDQTNIEIEPTLGVMGGAILATQNTGLVAMNRPKPQLFRLQQFIDPLPSAYASVNACGAVTTGDCLDDTGQVAGANLQVFYDNCQSSGMDGAGYWRSYFVLRFESQATCNAVKASGFTGAGLAAVAGEKVTRNIGSLGNPDEDQENVRLATVVGDLSEAVFIYSNFPSGWDKTKEGGVEITFENSTTRRMVIKGMHVKAARFTQMPISTTGSFDLTTLGSSLTMTWDHTINTVTTGETLFNIGPAVVGSAGSASFGESSDAPTATFDGDIVVSGNTVQAGSVFRIQQNIAQGVAVAIVTSPLVYDDANCCWPSSGVIESRFDLSYPAPTVEDRIEFTGTACGAVVYETSEGVSARNTLTHCF
jgi:hypothetical protein